MQWAVAHPRGTVAATQTGADTSVALRARARTVVVPPTAAAAQVGTDVPVAESMEITTFTGDATLLSGTGTMVTAGSRLLSGTSVPAVGVLSSPRPTMSSRLR
jgi:hypothetical protein